MHPGNDNKRFHNQQVAMERARGISGVDDGVGQVMAAAGPPRFGGQHAVTRLGSGMDGRSERNLGDERSHPADRHELMMQSRSSSLPGKIPAGQTCDRIVKLRLPPSVLGHLGLGDEMPTRPSRQGVIFATTSRREDHLGRRDVYEMETTRASGRDNGGGASLPAYELYDMQADPKERFNLFGQPGTGRRARSPSGSTDSSPTMRTLNMTSGRRRSRRDDSAP